MTHTPEETGEAINQLGEMVTDYERLVAINAKLLEALEALMQNMDSMNGDFSRLAWPCHCDLPECPDTMARTAIAEAKGK